jgi:hypothetical protein
MACRGSRRSHLCPLPLHTAEPAAHEATTPHPHPTTTPPPPLHCRMRQELEYGQELLQQLYLERENKFIFRQVSSHHVEVLQVRRWAAAAAAALERSSCSINPCLLAPGPAAAAA